MALSENPDGGEHYLHRPYLTKETMDAINAKKKINSKGQILDSIGKKWLDPGTQLDLGHVPEHEFWYERNMAEKAGMTQAEFNKYMNNPDFYAWQDMHDNRSHQFESKH